MPLPTSVTDRIKEIVREGTAFKSNSAIAFDVAFSQLLTAKTAIDNAKNAAEQSLADARGVVLSSYANARTRASTVAAVLAQRSGIVDSLPVALKALDDAVAAEKNAPDALVAAQTASNIANAALVSATTALADAITAVGVGKASVDSKIDAVRAAELAVLAAEDSLQILDQNRADADENLAIAGSIFPLLDLTSPTINTNWALVSADAVDAAELALLQAMAAVQQGRQVLSTAITGLSNAVSGLNNETSSSPEKQAYADAVYAEENAQADKESADSILTDATDSVTETTNTRIAAEQDVIAIKNSLIDPLTLSLVANAVMDYRNNWNSVVVDLDHQTDASNAFQDAKSLSLRANVAINDVRLMEEYISSQTDRFSRRLSIFQEATAGASYINIDDHFAVAFNGIDEMSSQLAPLSQQLLTSPSSAITALENLGESMVAMIENENEQVQDHLDEIRVMSLANVLSSTISSPMGALLLSKMGSSEIATIIDQATPSIAEIPDSATVDDYLDQYGQGKDEGQS